MSETEKQLLAILKDRCFKLGSFTLSSGLKSNHYIDGRMASTHPVGASLIGKVLFERTRGLGVDGIGGLEVGAVPLVTAAVIHYGMAGVPIEGFWVRGRSKEHGMKKLVEGTTLGKGAKVVIVDDVITRGGSAMNAVEAAQAEGYQVVQVLALVDRLQGARELVQKSGIPYEAVFTIEDFGVSVQPAEPAGALAE